MDDYFESQHFFIGFRGFLHHQSRQLGPHNHTSAVADAESAITAELRPSKPLPVSLGAKHGRIEIDQLLNNQQQRTVWQGKSVPRLLRPSSIPTYVQPSGPSGWFLPVVTSTNPTLISASLSLSLESPIGNLHLIAVQVFASRAKEVVVGTIGISSIVKRLTRFPR